MKKMSTLFFAAKMFLMFFAAQLILSGSAFATTVSIPASTGDNGSVYDIPVNIDNATAVAGYQFTITYDTAVLNCTTALRGSLTAGFDSPSNTITPGQVVTLSIEPSLTELTGGSGSLALIRCTVTGAGGTNTSLHFVPEPATVLANGNGDAIAATYVDGSFTVNGGCVPSTEICDGLDNDCDALIDEDLTRPTSCGVGACAGTGLETCTMGVWGSDTCAPGNPMAEVCDGIDNNCDGAIDNGIASTPTSCGVGVCARTGSLSCVGGAMVDSCAPGAPIGADNNCNNIDENCNGTSDENYVPTPTSCGVGACFSTGQMVCVLPNHALADTCLPLDPQTEGPYGNLTCEDTLDNDCDGTADAADTDCSASGILPVRIAGTTPAYYQTIGAAYDAAVNADIIEVRAAEFIGDLIFDRHISVTLKGGYDPAYSAVSGMTTVIGAVTIGVPGSGAGALTVGELIIR